MKPYVEYANRCTCVSRFRNQTYTEAYNRVRGVPIHQRMCRVIVYHICIVVYIYNCICKEKATREHTNDITAECSAQCASQPAPVAPVVLAYSDDLNSGHTVSRRATAITYTIEFESKITATKTCMRSRGTRCAHSSNCMA